MRTSSRVLYLVAMLGIVPAASGAAGGPVATPQPRVAEQTPEQRAKLAYNAGIRLLKRADGLAAGAAQATDAAKRERATARADDAYRKALAKFEQAVRDAPDMHEAWNYVGYVKRRLGELDAALDAYDRALSIRPGYAEAIEYRGEAYLRLNRLEEAKQAYLDLYAGHRPLADQLLAAMQEWIGMQRASASASDATMFDEFERWVRERVALAAQTAALTREGTAKSWQ